MIPAMVLHKRSAMPEGTRRATLNQELIRRMINTSELVPIEKRLEIIDKYAGKLLNSEYNMIETRRVIIDGLKGYERLLSLSKDLENPRWKPLHMARGWNARNRRLAKQKSKTGWYKGKTEVEPPSSIQEEERACKFSIHPEDHSTHSGKLPEGVSSLDTTPLAVPSPSEARKEPGKNDTKKRGPKRGILTLGGVKRLETAKKRKQKRNLNRKLGMLGVQEGWSKRKGPLPPTKSVLFVDNTIDSRSQRMLLAA